MNPVISGEQCKAAQFRTSRDLTISNTIGSCTLLMISRSTKPQAYRASLYRDEYLESQCHNICKLYFNIYLTESLKYLQKILKLF